MYPNRRRRSSDRTWSVLPSFAEAKMERQWSIPWMSRNIKDTVSASTFHGSISTKGTNWGYGEHYDTVGYNELSQRY